MTEGKVNFKNQNVFIEDRNRVTITGVEQVDSFNDNTIVLRTVKGGMTIKGEGLNVGQLNLDNGNVKVNGIINGIIYNDKDSSQRGNIIGKIFK
ncbi:MAG: sporulation protein YabP [Tissierellia bacterium]|nr:sporulation protein YabP [Tissierellia bacterium]